jgi:DNA (cytosine-5)-methyltransferase 1
LLVRQRADELQAGALSDPRPVSQHGSDACRPGPTNGHWADADWLYCRDDKWRPVEPGTFPLAHGATARVGRLRAYGNAIVPQVAEAVIRAYMQ